MMTSSNGNIFRVTGPLCGEFTGHLWIPRTKASDVELWCFLWSAPWINGWVNSREAGDLRHHGAHHDVIVMDLVRWHVYVSPCLSPCIEVWSHQKILRNKSGIMKVTIWELCVDDIVLLMHSTGTTMNDSNVTMFHKMFHVFASSSDHIKQYSSIYVVFFKADITSNIWTPLPNMISG